MAGLIIPSGWDSQPQEWTEINRGNQITTGLQSVLLPHLSVDPLTNARVTRNGTVVYQSTSRGLAHLGNGVGLFSLSVPTTMFGSAATILVVGNLLRIGSSIIGGISGSGGTQLFVIQCEGATSTGLRALVRAVNAGATTERRSTVYAATGNTDIIACVAAVYAGAADIDLYLDGNLDNGTLAATGASGSLTGFDSVGLGGVERSTDLFAKTAQLTLMVLAWNRAFSPAEARSVTADPWQIFAPSDRRIWQLATAVTFNPAWASGVNVIHGGGIQA